MRFLTEALDAANARFEPSWLLHRPGVQFGSGFTKKQDPQSMLDFISMKYSLRG
jgi:hypothetical protein